MKILSFIVPFLIVATGFWLGGFEFERGIWLGVAFACSMLAGIYCMACYISIKENEL